MKAAAETDARDMLHLEQQVCYALVVASRSVLAVYRPLLEPMGLTHPQYLVMLALWEQAPLSVKDLSALLQLDPGTMSPLLKRLEVSGLLTRERDRNDERQLSVSLTAAGTKLRERALLIPPAIMKKLDMTADELHGLHATLTRVILAAGDANPGK